MTVGDPRYEVLHIEAVGADIRLAFLLQDVATLVPARARAVAFTDLGGNWLEVIVVGADRPALAAWLAGVLVGGRATAAARAGEALALTGAAELADDAERAGYLDELVGLSGRALAELTKHPDRPVPEQVVAAEVLDVHRRRGDVQRSVAWQLWWLDPDADRRSPPPGTRGDRITARLAHGQWLRLSGGRPDPRSEVDLLRSYR